MSARRPSLVAWLLSALSLLAVPAHAQFRPRIITEPTVGEKYHIEGAVELWFPTADLVVTSSGSGALSGLQGSAIDAKRDLGLSDKMLPQLEFIGRPSKNHKFRVQFIPIKYTQSTTLTTDIKFNGQLYRLGVPVNSTLDWKAARFGYEYDFVTFTRGFVGFIIEAKYTDVRVDLASPFQTEFAHARAPIPAIGGIGRVYVVPQVSISAEVTGFKLPDTIENRYAAHYVDVDVYGTFNATNNVGIKGGYRSLDLGYLVKEDSGSFKIKGAYVGVVVRY